MRSVSSKVDGRREIPFPHVRPLAYCCTIGAAASTPGARRTSGNNRSSNPSVLPAICRLARPATASTVSEKEASAEWLASRTATNTATPSATPAIVEQGAAAFLDQVP